MGAIFLANDSSLYKVNDKVMASIKISNKSFLENLKKEIDKYDNLLFISGNPDDYKLTEEKAQIIEKSLSLSGIKFNMSDILDTRNWLFTRSLVKNSDLIVFLDGDCIEQMEFFNNIELKEKIKKINGCIIAIGNSCVNLANYAYCSQDSKNGSSVYYRGIGLVDLNIEPQFSIRNKKRLESVLLRDSKERSFIALKKDSYIVCKKESSLYGSCYYFNSGAYKEITSLEELKVNKKD